MRLDEQYKRVDYMIDQLLKYGYISVNAMAKQLYVSPATVRRDLKTLEADGLVHRTHGGAVHVAQVSDKLARFYRDREITCLEEKRVIGRAAADLARDGETVALASGSTTAQVALNLTQWRRLTVITNDLSHVRALSEFDQVSVFVPGGFVRLGRDNLIGPNSIPSVRDFRIDRLYLSVTAAHLQHGVSAGHILNVMYLRELVAVAKSCILVADHTKFELPPLVTICDWSEIDTVVTDRLIPLETAESLRQRGLKVIIAE